MKAQARDRTHAALHGHTRLSCFKIVRAAVQSTVLHHHGSHTHVAFSCLCPIGAARHSLRLPVPQAAINHLASHTPHAYPTLWSRPPHAHRGRRRARGIELDRRQHLRPDWSRSLAVAPPPEGAPSERGTDRPTLPARKDEPAFKAEGRADLKQYDGHDRGVVHRGHECGHAAHLAHLASGLSDGHPNDFCARALACARARSQK